MSDDGLVDMKLSAGELRAHLNPAPMGPEYPWGLCLRLENAELDKLGRKRLPEVGDEFDVTAVAKVTSVHESKSEGNHGDRAVTLQVVRMKLK